MPFSRYREALDSSDLSLLQRVFDRLCIDRGIVPTSSDAEDIASHLVSLWQSGHHDEDVLHAIARTRNVANLKNVFDSGPPEGTEPTVSPLTFKPAQE